MRRLLGLATIWIASLGSPVVSLELAPADISGKVIDEETGQPILGAVVKVGLKGATNRAGRHLFLRASAFWAKAHCREFARLRIA